MSKTANCNKDRNNPRIGDVYLMEFTGSGSEQSGRRPGLVFQNNVGNKYSPNIIALPLTSSLKKLDMPTHVLVKAKDSGLLRDSVVLCENPQRMSKERIGNYITTLPKHYMKEIAMGHLIATSAISFLDIPSIINAWKKSVEINIAVA